MESIRKSRPGRLFCMRRSWVLLCMKPNRLLHHQTRRDPRQPRLPGAIRQSGTGGLIPCIQAQTGPHGTPHSHPAHLRIPAALRLGPGGAVRHSAARHARPAGRRRAFGRAPAQLPPGSGLSRPRRPGRRQLLVLRRPPLRALRAAHSLQALAGADHLRPPHPGLLWPPPPGHPPDRQIRPRPGHPRAARRRPERHGLRRVPPLRRHRRHRLGGRPARRRPPLRRRAQARPQPARLGRPLLRRSAPARHRGLLRGSHRPPPHGPQGPGRRPPRARRA